MANIVKKKKNIPDPNNLITDKVEQVAWSSLNKDSRTIKIIGVVLLLISIFLFIAFTSYLFTWRTDQSQVMANGIHYVLVDNVQASNMLGRLGALLSHFFIYSCFGVAAYLLSSFFALMGFNVLLGRAYFKVVKHIKYMLIGLMVISILMAYLFAGSSFSWGGQFGNTVSGWLSNCIGTLGTGIVLCAATIVYIIWRFNPSISSLFAPKTKQVPQASHIENSLDYEAANFTTHEPNTAQEQVAQEFATKGNSLKKTSAISVIPPLEVHTPYNHELQLVQKEPDTEASLTPDPPQVTTMPPLTLPKKEKIAPAEQDLELLITTGTTADDVPKEKVPAKAATTLGTPYEPTLDLSNYKYPTLDMLENHGSERIVQDPNELENNKNQIITTLRNYDIEIQKIMATVGPTVTLYEIVPAPGVRISRIKNLEDDIALSLAALGIRIIAPIPGKGTIGIEVPNIKKTIVSMKTLLASEKFINNSHSLPIALGKRIDNENFIVDLATMPHLLMAGATGQGKSVGLNAVLVSLLYKKHPSQLKLVLVDPKKVELSLYRHIEKHFLAMLPGEHESIITDTKKVVHTLNALCIEMDNRYDLLKEAGCRNIKEYNEKFIARKLNPEKGHQYLPFIVLVIDEFADLIMTAGKEVEMPIARLAQLARAIGIHLIIATQRPSVNIITGTIKANFPARIAFKVSSKIDSRTILDTGGAEQLIGKGDMLVSYNGEVTRLQCAFVDTPEVDKVVAFIGDQQGYPQAFLLPEYLDEKDSNGKEFNMDERDTLFEDAAKLIVMSQNGSTSLIQRKLKLGYNRSGRLMDQLEAANIVGPNLGNKPREVYIKTDADLMEHLSQLG